MNKRVIAQLVAFSFLAGSALAIAAGPPPDESGQMAGAGRQQVMPTIPHRDWHKGQRVPAEYRHYNFVLNDWRGQGLNAPPRGHQWLGVNGDYVLVTTSNWTISNIVSGTE
jgi:Ni/Co efflux regulator RcnB